MPTRTDRPLLIDTSVKRRGREVQARLRKRSGTKNFRTMDLAEEVAKLMEPPNRWPKYLIAQSLGITERRVAQALAYRAKTMHTKPLYEDITDEARAMLAWSVDAFERFFITFSGYDSLPNHVRPWIAAFLAQRNLILNVPPRHAKSTYFMVWIPIWLICRDRNVQLLLVSKTHEFAQNWALEIAANLEHNEGLIKAYGAFKADKEGDQKWKPNSGTFTVLGRTKTIRGAQFTVESRGMNGQVLGREADFIMVDDPTDQEEAESETSRRRELKHLQEQVFTRAEPQADKPGGRIAVVGQRVHLLDVYGTLAKMEWEIGPNKGEKLWHVEKYPAVLDWDSKRVLWPERHSWDELMLTYARVGGHGPFSTLFQQEPLPEGSALVTQAWVEGCRDHSRNAFQGMRVDDAGAQVPVVRVLSLDPSPTKFNGIVVGDLFYNKDRFVFAMTEAYRLQAGQYGVKAKVDEIINRAKPDYFIFEESGFLHWFRDDPWFMELKDRVKLELHHTGANKNSMEYGVQSLAGDFEFKNLSFPYGDDEARRMSDLVSGEALIYPYGETTDMLMALWFIKFNYKRLSPVRFLPTRVKGTEGRDTTWSWYKQLKGKKNTQEAAYQKYKADKAKRQAEMRKVAVG